MRWLISTGSLLVLGLLVLPGCGSSSAPPVAANPAPVAPAPAPVVAPAVAPPFDAAPVALTPALRASTIAPLLDDMTVAIGYVDLARLNVEPALAEFNKRLEKSGEGMTAEQQKEVLDAISATKKLVQQAYLVVSLNDVPIQRPYLVLRMVTGADPKQVFALVSQENAAAALDEKSYEKQTLVKDDLLVYGDEPTILRLKSLTPTAIANLEPAFTAAGEATTQLVFVPTDSARTQLGRMVGDLPPELNLNGPDLITAIKFGALTFDMPPSMQLKLEVQGQDASASQRLHSAITSSVDYFKRQFPVPLPQDAQDMIQALIPQLEAEKLTVTLKQGEPIVEKLTDQAMAGIVAARDAARQMQNANNLKQIGLAMHNNAAATGLLPEAYSKKDGMPLLSWRVHLLPMLGEQELYQQFKLDEPWDSAHNLPLAQKMPSVYAKTPANQAAGTTTYLVPIGEKTPFTGNAAISIAEISDGTSNTLLVVDAAPEKAVVWTKPEDWQVDINNPFTGLPNKPFQALMCDGSVRMFNPTGNAEQFAHVIARNDSNVIDWSTLATASPVGAVPFPMMQGGGMPPGAMDPRSERSGTTINPSDPSSMPGAIGPDGRPLTPGESVFITQAKQAFSEGRDKDAFNYLYAEAVAGEDKDGLRKTLSWFDAIKRPAMALRWGIGIQYNAPRNYSGGPSTIGRIVQGQQQPNSGGNNAGGDPSAPQPGAPPQTVLEYYTGELGTKLLDGLRTRSEQGQFGEVLKLIAGTPGVNANTSSPPVDRNGKPIVPKVQSLAPGIVFLGQGKDKDLLAKAKEEELDALIVFAVGVQPSRTVVTNTTKMIVYDVAKGTEVFESKAIKATVVEIVRKEGKGNDPVDEMMEKFFATLDGNYKVGELPATATPDKAAIFANKLAESASANKLPILLAILFFQDKASMPAADAKVAFEKLMGPEIAVQLLGDVPSRQKAIAPLLPKLPAGPNAPGGLGTGKRLGLGQ